MSSCSDFIQQQIGVLSHNGIRVVQHGASQLTAHVPYCGASVAIAVEVFADATTPGHVVLDVVSPRDVPLGSVGLTELTSIAAPVPIATSKNALLSVVSDVMQHVTAAHANKAQAIGHERWQFELNTFLSLQKGVLFHVSDDGGTVSVAVPLAVELPKHYSLYGSDPRTAALLVRFELARMTSAAPGVSLMLPNRLERLLYAQPALPSWDKSSDCLSVYIPKARQFLDDFCHNLRVRRAVVNTLVKLLGSKLEVDHVHYLRARFLRRTASTNPQTMLTLHVDLPLSFPMEPPRLGISCLTWLDDGSSSRDGVSRPFSREVPAQPWVPAEMTSTEMLASAIAQLLIGAVDAFVRKASNGSRNTVYFLQRPTAAKAAPAPALQPLSPRREQQR